MNFDEFLRAPFLRTSMVAASEDEHDQNQTTADDIPIKQLLSLNDS